MESNDSKNSEVWVSCLQPFPTRYSINFTNDHSNNWDVIKKIFRRATQVRCSWMRDILQFDDTTNYHLENHNDCFRAKVKYDLLINGTKEMLQCFNKPSRWMKLSREFFIELSRHNCISYFNTRKQTNFFRYLDECLLELNEMREDMIKDGVSFHEFILRDKNYYDVEYVDTDDQLLRRYPIYGDLLKGALNHAYDRKILLKELLDAQVYTERADGSFTNLDCDSVRLIARFLSNSDLVNILSVF